MSCRGRKIGIKIPKIVPYEKYTSMLFTTVTKIWVLILFSIAIISIILMYAKETCRRFNNNTLIQFNKFEKIEEKDIRQILKLKKNDSIQCYRIKYNSLKDISEITPRKGKSIFFLETSCNSYEKGKLTISSRQACAVESAAKMNPNLDVFLLYSSPGLFRDDGNESDRFLQALLGYKNIKILHLDYGKYVNGTLVEDLYTSGKLERSKHVVAHASDVLRLLTLWKYGGIYLDLDVLVLKSIENIPLNFAGIESETEIGNSILSFDAVGNGHIMAESCLKDLQNNFDGDKWSYNGPSLITRLLRSVCEEANPINMTGKYCNGFKVYPQNAFYPIPFSTWNKYFDESYLNEVLNITKDSNFIHIWNKLSNEAGIPITSNAPYLYLARKYCPNVVANCNTHF